jgi:hypothetical protein
LCHAFRTHCLAKHTRARMCLIISERRFLGLIRRAKHLFSYRRTVSALTVTPSLYCSILESWWHWSPSFTSSFRRRAGGFSGRQGHSGPVRPRRIVQCPGSFTAPTRLIDCNPHGCFTLLRGLTSAVKSSGFVDEASMPCEYNKRSCHTAKTKQST